jgi:tetratricopeptide (TPR) repeat protein/predicted Ser/Thr protein kinase
MANDISQASMQHADSRSSDIHRARAQVESARLRQQELAATGNLIGHRATPAMDGGQAIKSLPGYTIVRELHRGGQGVVYLAVQNSTGRQVAIKLLNRELPPGAGSTGVARFEREIDILSRLKHPNIVTVHDCGRDHGHVFLVMDYVIGRPLDAWVDRDRTPLAHTLEVFARICDGVNAAHLRGVIHRDLKPGNILVDDNGEPHVLDFGLAKLVEDSVGTPAATAPMTITGQFVGSLPWASPEQAEGRTESLDIRTDVYSLGVILYQILTGRFPYPVSGRLSEVVRHIAETNPTRPSTIERRIDRELETILLKCLSKDPDRRYQSAGDLARDVRRYLAGEAIEARRDSLVYVMGKQLARYRVAMIVAGSMLLVVLGALGFSLAYWRQAAAQRTIAEGNARAAQASADRADREALQARAVFEFMREVLTSVDPEQQGVDVRLFDVLQSASTEAARRFEEHPQQEAEVRDMLARVYDKLSLWPEAKAEFEKAASLWGSSAGSDDPRTLESQSRAGFTSINLIQTSEAERLLHDVLPRLERVHGKDHPKTLEVLRGIAVTHLFRGRVDEAERMLKELRAHPRLVGNDEAHIRILSGLNAVHASQMSIDDAQRRREIALQSEPLALEWIERSTRVAGPDSPSTIRARTRWADLACQLGRFQEAADACRDILERTSERLGPCHHARTAAMQTLGEALAGLGEIEEPADLQIQIIECHRQRLESGSLMYLSSLSESLRYVERAGVDRADEGEALARELLAGLKGHGGTHDVSTFLAESYLAHFVSMQQRLQEAEELFQPVLAASEHLHDAPRTRACLEVFYGQHLTRTGQFQQAEAHLDKATTLVGDIRFGTWDTHPDEIVLAYIRLYEAWDRPEKRQEYERLRDEIGLRPSPE